MLKAVEADEMSVVCCKTVHRYNYR